MKSKVGKAPKPMAMQMPIEYCVEGGMELAHAYVPWQIYDKAFCPQEALMKGTLFPELFGVYMIPN